MFVTYLLEYYEIFAEENPSLKFAYGRKSAVTFRKLNIF